MKLYFLFVFLFLFEENALCWRIFHHGRMTGGGVGSPPFKRRIKGAKNDVFEKWLDQNLDHFNPGNEKKWKQRYFVTERFFTKSPKGPVFLMIGGEGEASEQWMHQGTWIDYATLFKALCFQLEHRYYGKSHPTSDMSVKNLQYLSSQQALADIAVFIEKMNEEYKLGPDVKWIVFGGSYPGSLAAWMRMKYPHLVHGAMSASGPLRAKVDFKEYLQVVDEALCTYSEECALSAQLGTRQVEILMETEIGQRNLNGKFRLCDPMELNINNTKDVSNFFESIAGNFAGIVQYNKDNRMNGIGADITIDTLCRIMVNDSLGPPIDRLAAVNNLILQTYNQPCLDYKYAKMVQEYRNASWKSGIAEGGRQWFYQTCTEFGFFQTSKYSPHRFGDKFRVEFFTEQCEDIFGSKYNKDFVEEAVKRTNIFYGALDISISNVVFVHGSIDPWHALGITATHHQGAPAIYINGTAHCANMYPAKSSDPPQLVAARVAIGELIDSWLSLN